MIAHVGLRVLLGNVPATSVDEARNMVERALAGFDVTAVEVTEHTLDALRCSICDSGQTHG